MHIRARLTLPPISGFSGALTGRLPCSSHRCLAPPAPREPARTAWSSTSTGGSQSKSQTQVPTAMRGIRTGPGNASVEVPPRHADRATPARPAVKPHARPRSQAAAGAGSVLVTAGEALAALNIVTGGACLTEVVSLLNVNAAAVWREGAWLIAALVWSGRRSYRPRSETPRAGGVLQPDQPPTLLGGKTGHLRL